MPTLTVGDLLSGQLFRFCNLDGDVVTGEIFMKCDHPLMSDHMIEKWNPMGINAIWAATGKLCKFDPTTRVQIVNGKFIEE